SSLSRKEDSATLRRTVISSLDGWPAEGPGSAALRRSSDSALACFAWSVIGRIVNEFHRRNTRKYLHWLCSGGRRLRTYRRRIGGLEGAPLLRLRYAASFNCPRNSVGDWP